MGASPQQIALAWLLAKGEQVLAIPAASRKETVEDSAKAADMILTAKRVAALDVEASGEMAVP